MDRDGKKPTHNRMGYMNYAHNPALDDFLALAKKTKGRFADIGAAFGYASLEALKCGAEVWAVDLEQTHLDVLARACPKDLMHRLHLCVGHFPQTTHLPDSYFEGVLMSKVLLFYEALEIDRALKAAYDLLKDEGFIYITSPSPFRKSLAIYQDTYSVQRDRGDLWPGRVFDYTLKFPHHDGYLPDELQFIDEHALNAGLERVGFKSLKSGYWPQHERDGREAFDIVFAIAQKVEKIKR